MNTAGPFHISVTDPDFKSVIVSLLEDNVEVNDSDTSEFIESEYDSESDQNADDIIVSDNVDSDSSDNDETTRTSKYFYGKNKYKWSADECISKYTRTARLIILLREFPDYVVQ